MTRIVFVKADGNEQVVDAENGLSVMEVAVRNGIDIEATCEGSLACATCHLIVDEEWYDKLPPKLPEEDDMLDFAFNLTKNSRLSCQIKITPELDGIKFRVPA